MEVPTSISFWLGVKEIIEQVCNEFDSQWQKRKRVLNTYFLVLFIFRLVLSKNSQGYSTTLYELWDACLKDNDIALPQEKPVSASSICEARKKLPEEVFQKLNQKILNHYNDSTTTATWQGHRVFAVDGAKLNLPKELIQEAYKIPDEKRMHYPIGLMSGLYNLGEGMIHDVILSSQMDERLCAIDHMKHLEQEDIMVLDRGYFSYLLLYKSVEAGINIICRMQSGNVNKAIKAFWESEKTDMVIDYEPSTTVKFDLKKKGYNLAFKKIPLRLIKYSINGEVYVCATTLIEPKYEIEAFPKLYHGRWGIEELYKISKQFIDVEDFHSRTERGIKQELYAHMLLINLARLFEVDAKNELPPPSDEDISNDEIQDSYWQDLFVDVKKLKINFKHCLHVVGGQLERLFLAGAQTIKCWLPKAIEAIARIRQKIRPGRHYPRISHKPSKKWVSSNHARAVNS